MDGVSSPSRSPIPIHNIYYLLCYAWDKLDEAQLIDVSSIQSPELAELFARVLINGTRHIIRRGLDRGYQVTTEEMPGIRGRIQIGESIRNLSFERARAVCQFDELTHDILHNQILKTTLLNLAKVENLDKKLRAELIAHAREIPQAKVIPLSKRTFRLVQLHRHNAFYGFLINVCELIFDNLLPTQHPGNSGFRDFLRDEKQMAALFENFVLNFYRRELPEYAAKSEKLDWNTRGSYEVDLPYLPRMITDISLRSATRTIIIDTKYYRDCIQTYHSTPKARSENLYQLMAYLHSLEAQGGNDAQAEGILLYPEVNRSLDLQYILDGHSVRLYTLNLAQPWAQIREDLIMLVTPAMARESDSAFR